MKLKKCVSLITALLTVSLIAACGVSEDRGNRGGDESIKAVSYTHLDVYKRQRFR